MSKLDVFRGSDLVGQLVDVGDGQLGFAYAPQWLARPDAQPLTPAVPLMAGMRSGDGVTAFFENLLPEGSIRDFIGRATHISPGNVFGMLERFGGDTAGAISLVPEGETPAARPHYLPVTHAQVREWLSECRGIPLGVMDGEQARMLLSGAQDKITVFINAEGALSLPLGTAPSSHIVKPSQPHRPGIPGTAINEALVMMLAREVGLEVPAVWYEPALEAVVIERYDRTGDHAGGLQRLHQYDVCQALSIQSTRKYESDGGPSLAGVFEAVEQASGAPGADRKRLVEWVAFNLAAGNMDSHAKNLSFIEREGAVRLAPFYDLLCTRIYPTLTQRFAFKIGGENRPDWIMDRHWKRFAEAVGVKPQFVRRIIAGMFDRVATELPRVADRLREGALSDQESRMIEQVERAIHAFAAKQQVRHAMVRAGGAGNSAVPAVALSPNKPSGMKSS